VPGHYYQKNFGFYVDLGKPRSMSVMPHWFLLLVSSSAGILPWIRWSTRFSLRTLLIATTLVAVGLGLIVYAAR
jgi:hypothetical protein